ncbi:MAG: peptidoglycan-N-acetylglucosamine deacetylase [Actinomycetota bacterium]|nr:peptidoglycan-N-acetylglucosamine deacetylase [Actinomycetota bacterium]
MTTSGDGRVLIGLVGMFFLLAALLLPADPPARSASSPVPSSSPRPTGTAAPTAGAPVTLTPLLRPSPESQDPAGGSAGGPAGDEPKGPHGCPAPAPSPVSWAPGTGPTVALTFDDGPSRFTAGILDLLAHEQVPATFFVIGGNVASDPRTVARAAREGHLIGDHSWHHQYPKSVKGGWTRSYLRGEMLSSRIAITAATGEPVCWFRPPGGTLTPSVTGAARELGFSLALWSVDTLDWKIQNGRRPTAVAVGRIVDRAATGLDLRHPVILLHDGGGNREAEITAVRRIIALYREHGYRFVRLDERS